MDKTTRMGPVVSAQRLQTVLGRRAGRREGATLAAGGTARRVGDGRGYFIQPTVFTGVSNGIADRARGDLRPGPVRHSLQGRRRAVAQRQRDLRPGRRRLDTGRGQALGSLARSGRDRVGERLQPLRRRSALRRLRESGFGRGLGRPGSTSPRRSRASGWISRSQYPWLPSSILTIPMKIGNFPIWPMATW
jgi:hypothetical protein